MIIIVSKRTRAKHEFECISQDRVALSTPRHVTWRDITADFSEHVSAVRESLALELEQQTIYLSFEDFLFWELRNRTLHMIYRSFVVPMRQQNEQLADEKHRAV